MAEDIIFESKNITCCSLELHWKYNSKEKDCIYSYKVYQKEGGDHYLTNYWYFQEVYKGQDTNYEAINLKQDQNYTFKLEIIKNESVVTSKNIGAKTLKIPPGIVSEKSLEIYNGEITDPKEKIQDRQKNIVQNCSKLIFSENDDNVLKGVFDGIIINLTHEEKDNIYYLSFDLESNYFNDFFKQYLEECNHNITIPCHFIIPKLPNIFILDLLEKSSVIFTGSRMGGVIASSLAFYIMDIGKKMNKNYGNTFIKTEKKSLGVVTFGSPTFLTNLASAIKMRELTSYFYHIKEEYDFIPEIIDYISSNKSYFDSNNKYLKEINLKELINIFNKIELEIGDINLLNKYLQAIYFTENNLQSFIEMHIRIPFGYYYMMKTSDASMISINEHTFMQFYYWKKFDSNKNTSHLTIYKKLNSDVNFDKKNLEYLLNKDNKIEIIKIIRRNNESEKNSNQSNIKIIIKFDLNSKTIHENITPDIIKKIELSCSDNPKIIIPSKYIFYDNDNDITAYIDVPNESNVSDVTIVNHFSGEIKAKFILNIQGSGKTRKMLYDNLEKIFLIPFFKLFEIIYISKNDNKKYEELKNENFGPNFSKLKILEPFEKQIMALNELLLFTRPDLLSKNENQFIEDYIRKDLKEKKDENKKKDEKEKKDSKDLDLNYEKQKEIIESVKNQLTKYYEKAKKLQEKQNFDCINSENESIAQQNYFPNNSGKKEIKKLFMCEFDNIECNKKEDIIFKEYDNSYIKEFLIKNCIVEVLSSLEHKLKEKLIDLKSESKFKKYLNENIGEYYISLIIPKIFFIRMIILVSIEGGDLIKFNHKLDFNKLTKDLVSSPTKIINLIPYFRDNFYENDFVKIFSKEIIENIHIKNLFYKKKMKNLINSNIDFFDTFSDNKKSNNSDNTNKNKIRNFSDFSESGNKFGEEYYENFLQLLNNYSNDYYEDIETSIYENLKEDTITEEKGESDSTKNNFIFLLDMINDNIIDEESKKGFLALLRQSFLLGKLRSNIVSKSYYN